PLQLPSFPTRRSSDLGASSTVRERWLRPSCKRDTSAKGRDVAGASPQPQSFPPMIPTTSTKGNTCTGGSPRFPLRRQPSPPRSRSEEHTSELQSPDHL